MIKEILYSIFSIILVIILWGYLWGILNIQTCSSAGKNASCEEIAKNSVENCTYKILFWKKNNYEKELRMCKNFYENNN
jgi:hypothetical protein